MKLIVSTLAGLALAIASANTSAAKSGSPAYGGAYGASFLGGEVACNAFPGIHAGNGLWYTWFQGNEYSYGDGDRVSHIACFRTAADCQAWLLGMGSNYGYRTFSTPCRPR